MSAVLSTAITELLKIGSSVVHSGRKNLQRVAEGLRQRFAPALGDGEPLPEFATILRSLIRLVASEVEKVKALDEEHVTELDGDKELLAERNAAFDEATAALTEIQSASEGVFGAGKALKLFGHVRLLPRRPWDLHRLGERVQRRLADPDYELPAPRPGWKLEREEKARDLARPIDRLGRALDALEGERKGTEVTRFDKREALDDSRRTIRHAAVCLAALFSLAGYEELAAKIRPKRRAPRRSAEDGTETAASPPDGEVDAGGESEGGDAESGERSGPTLVVS